MVEPEMEQSHNPIISPERMTKLNGVLSEMAHESDRAAAILISAEIDATLLALLVKYLLPAVNGRRLLETDAPLGSFSARIEILYRLGLISASFHRELHFIRKIRNEFAHQSSGVSFNVSPIKDLVGELSIPKLIAKYNRPFTESGMLDTPRKKFMISGTVLVASLSTLINRLNKVKPGIDEILPPQQNA